MTSKQLKMIRSSVNMFQDDFAQFLNVSIASVKGWERGKNPIPRKRARMIRKKIRNSGVRVYRRVG